MLEFKVTYTGEIDQITSPIEPSSLILPGSNKQFDVTVQDGYYISEIIINGVNQTLDNELASYSFDLQNILEDQNITIKVLRKVELIPEPTGVENTFSLPLLMIITLAIITLITSKLKKKIKE